MDARHSLVGFALVASVAACSAGTGSPIPIPSGKQEPPGTPADPGGSGNEPGKTGPDPTGGGAESGGTGGASPVPSACPACDLSYSCSGSDAGSITVTLTSNGGVCSISGSKGSVFLCSGTITFSPTTGPVSVPWTSVPGGGFAFGQVVCTPEIPSGAPGASGNGQG
jgi:hypothetical protein